MLMTMLVTPMSMTEPGYFVGGLCRVDDYVICDGLPLSANQTSSFI